MNEEQYKRFRKMTTEPIQCLYQTHDKQKNLFFLISGSSGTKYKVTIPNNGKIKCSCPDFSNGAKIQECVCKHCLHVIYNVIQLFKDVDHPFFNRCYFTPDEVHSIHNYYREMLKKRKNSLKTRKDNTNERSRTAC